MDLHISWAESAERECKGWQACNDAVVAELLDVGRYERRTEALQWFSASYCLHKKGTEDHRNLRSDCFPRACSDGVIASMAADHDVPLQLHNAIAQVGM
ncbi:hypothetical protein R4P64_29135 [Rhodococcus sp. IEGM 1366]|uniref:hypothetical protein n=1 Tax=Rhodococcus sp. IEGM 1366 TaxID=3082223 RepID=UPI0029539893|nr:hypothetical protein [Rhodococcus sp. IEGM 1366]MDV8070604.1 hypothetical protein [Rhodococcus sp. IEGM 1366]